MKVPYIHVASLRLGSSGLLRLLRNTSPNIDSISPFPKRHTAYQVRYGFSEMHDPGRGGHENADLVIRARTIIEAMGGKVIDPDSVRENLGLIKRAERG